MTERNGGQWITFSGTPLLIFRFRPSKLVVPGAMAGPLPMKGAQALLAGGSPHDLRMITQTAQGTAIPTREIAPPARRWIEEKGDEFSALKERFREWTASTEANEQLFKQHVYDSAEAFDGDFRQHRIVLCNSMAMGEDIALDFLTFLSRRQELEEEGIQYVKILDQKLASLREIFFKWHGGMETQTDLPESLKQATREIEAGEIEELEDL